MTPLYDVLSVWPYVGNSRGRLHWRELRLAMALRSKNTHYEIHTIRARHWHDLTLKDGGPRVWDAMQGLVDRVGRSTTAPGLP
jgi:serine/threonine-protein kinase HipA